MAKEAKKKVVKSTVKSKSEQRREEVQKEKKAKRPGDKYLVKFSFTNKDGEDEEFENEVVAKRMLQAVNTTLREAKQDALKSRKIKNLTLTVMLADQVVKELGE